MIYNEQYLTEKDTYAKKCIDTYRTVKLADLVIVTTKLTQLALVSSITPVH